MEWLSDPNMWLGLVTLIVLEIVLGIDNLIFIAILADKLPPHQRDKARLIGLSLALLMRLGLLAIVSWLVTLTTPLFTLGAFSFSARDLILLSGGIFLLVKATTELHERLEGATHDQGGSIPYAGFAVVVTQILVLDAVFSLDSIITAVGMVDELPVMMAAVVIAMGMMMWASRPLTRFVSAHPTVVVLCLSFLLMIGLSLTAEGLGFHIPKGYLYAAIGFSIMIEFFNQLARRRLMKNEARLPLRDRTADAVLRLMGSKKPPKTGEAAQEARPEMEEPAFGPEERNMVSGVLTLGERSIRSIMTPRTEISWINLDDERSVIKSHLRDTPHSFFPVCRGQLDNILGVARAKDLMADMSDGKDLNNLPSLRPPIIIHELAGVLNAMETLKKSRGQLVLVTDEYGAIEGLLTPIDILEAIAGEFPDEDEPPAIRSIGQGRWLVDGGTDLHYLSQVLETEIAEEGGDGFTSVAGLLLDRFGTLPETGATIDLGGLHFEVLKIADRRIATLRVTRVDTLPPAPPLSDQK
jgi:CBS domain containing-hemolysin-like protein